MLRASTKARALYEWNHARSAWQAGSEVEATKTDVFSEEFLLQRPLLTAYRRTEPAVLLIDETDKAIIEIEDLLLGAVRLRGDRPRTGHPDRPVHVLLTSNATRELSGTLGVAACTCIGFPTPSWAYLLSRFPKAAREHFAELVRIIGVLRGMQLKKGAIDRRDHRLRSHRLGTGTGHHRDAVVAATLGVVLRHPIRPATGLESSG